MTTNRGAQGDRANSMRAMACEYLAEEERLKSNTLWPSRQRLRGSPVEMGKSI
jgi:hypothetical protein